MMNRIMNYNCYCSDVYSQNDQIAGPAGEKRVVKTGKPNKQRSWPSNSLNDVILTFLFMLLLCLIRDLARNGAVNALRRIDREHEHSYKCSAWKG